jgi:hypothetical protein
MVTVSFSTGTWHVLDAARQRSGIANIQYPGGRGILRRGFVVVPEPRPTSAESDHAATWVDSDA